MSRVRGWLLALMLGLTMAMPLAGARAVQPDERLEDPVLEARAREISRELRCLVCQNQSIDDSDAHLARDLRVLVRERLAAGDSDQQVIDYIVARYGDFVLLRPPVKPVTYALWAAPVLLLALGIWALVATVRRSRRAAPPAALSDAERRALAQRLGQEEPRG
ncbi:MAG: cytochrome c-type biogenesis protein CcmH [Sphingomonadales bacterium]